MFEKGGSTVPQAQAFWILIAAVAVITVSGYVLMILSPRLRNRLGLTQYQTEPGRTALAAIIAAFLLGWIVGSGRLQLW